MSLTQRGTWALAAAMAVLGSVGAVAQVQPADATTLPLTAAIGPDWQTCRELQGDAAARLACFDHWAAQMPSGNTGAPVAANAAAALGLSATDSTHAATSATSAPAAPPPAPPGNTLAVVEAPPVDGCRDRHYSELSRFWELEAGSGCGKFGLRGYKPLTLSATIAKNPPGVPTSPAPDHTGSAIDYQRQEMRIGLSVRTKLAENIVSRKDPSQRDSLWFAYSQQSTWQVFNSDLSRPFRTTDHEPELMYVAPLDLNLPGGWRWRYAGVGVVHQSNGQSLPYSRSWNRIYAMGGMELDDRLRFDMKIWRRLNEGAATDDNPDISDFIGRAEFAGHWNLNPRNTLGLTWRSNLKDAKRGSVKLEWLYTLGDPATSNLRLHTTLFNGYGDTLIDYNRRRTVFGVGLSLFDF